MKKIIKSISLVLIILITFYFVQDKFNKNNTQFVFNEQETKKIALTFDDGPHPKYTKMLLDGLKERNVKATFFVIGQNIDNNLDLMYQMYEDGHIIGNHTYSHKNLYRLKNDKILEELNKTNELIESITNSKVKYFRPSYGNINERMQKLTDMKVVLWNVDSLDWKIRNSNRISKRVINSVHDGSIILMHDIYKSSIRATFKIIDELQKEGYEFVLVNELL